MLFAARQLPGTEYWPLLDLCWFDMVSRDGLWKIMAKYSCSEKFITVRPFHDDMQTRVQDNGESSVTFPITNGIKQGCVLGTTFLVSCFLWCCLMHLVAQMMESTFYTTLMALSSTSDQDEDWYCQRVSVCRWLCTECYYYQSQHAKQCWQILNGLWQFWLNHQHKKDRSDATASAWKTICQAQHHHQGTMTESVRKVLLPHRHPL